MKFKENYTQQLQRLNEYQKAAVFDESNACLVNANVGSGKTTVLITKVMYLHYEKQIPYEKMVVLTFTNKAADEIKERLYALEPEIKEEQLWGFGTFHSVCLTMLKKMLAGNIIDDHQLGSIEYAAGHLGCRLVVVLGHTHCGAVDAAINHEPSGYIRYITDEIKKAIGDERDPYKASCLNVRHSVQEIEKSLCIHNIEEETGLRVVGAMYHIEDGSVEFL